MPDPSRIPAPQIEELAGATVVPVAEGNNLPSGVLLPDGSTCDNARTMLGGPRFTDDPPPFDPATLTELPGRHLFGGIARVHFGHFLVETISRLWALDHLDTRPESLIFLPMPGRPAKHPFGPGLTELLKLLIGDLPLHILAAPTRAEHLLVPTQGVGHLAWSTGTPEFRHFVRSRLEAAYRPSGPEKLYISRTQLTANDKLVDCEDELEAMMQSAGYTVFHPEQHSVREQAEHYLAARVVVGADGSAFHFAAHLLQPGTRVGLIKRRHRTEVFGAISRQIEAFGAVDLATLHPLMPQEPGEEIARINLFRLERALRRKGFL